MRLRDDIAYFKVERGSKVEADIIAYRDAEQAWHDKAGEVVKNVFGVNRFCHQGCHKFGVHRSALDGNAVPDGWRIETRGKSSGLIVPRYSSASGRKLRKEMESLRPRSRWELAEDWFGHAPLDEANGRICFPGWEEIDDVLVVKIGNPERDIQTPDGCQRLKASKYWALRETEDND